MFRRVISHAQSQISRLGIRTYTELAIDSTNFEKTMNRVMLLGRVGGDPQKRGTEENPVVIFSLATHTNYKYNSGDFMQKTDWHKVCVFKEQLRDTVYNYLKKGQRVLVNGRLSYSEYTDTAGTTRLNTAIIADDVIFFHQIEHTS